MYLTCSSVKQTTKTHKEVLLPIQWKQPFPCKDRNGLKFNSILQILQNQVSYI